MFDINIAFPYALSITFKTHEGGLYMVIHVITACHNRILTTEKFVKSIKKQSYKQIHLILVDDGCTDGTSEMVYKEMPDATVIRGNGNLFWGGALHKAYKWVINNKLPNDDDIFFTNDDNIFKKTYLEESLERLKTNPNSLITGNGFSMQTGKQCDGVSYCNLKTGEITLLGTDAEGNLADTRSLMMWVKDLKRIGGFHPILLPHYLSDYEFVLRAAKKGYVIKTFNNLRFDYDRSLTGIKNLSKLSVRRLFSKRCPYNPIYKFSYIFLVTPIKYIPARIGRQIQNYFLLFTKKKDIGQKVD